MGYEFSFGWAFAGMGVMVAGIVFLRFFQWIADNLGAGVADYEHYKLYGLIAIAGGFLTMINILPLILYLVTSSLFGGGGADTPPIIEE